MERDKRKEKAAAFWRRYRLPLLVLLAGVGLLLWPVEKKAEASAPAIPEKEESTALRETEERMRSILSRIHGVGQLELMLTVESTMEREFAMDTELSYSGTTSAPDDYTRRSETVILSGDAGEEAVVVREIATTYRGALVVCQGGDHAEVKLAVTQAVAALTGLSSDRITVVRCQS